MEDKLIFIRLMPIYQTPDRLACHQRQERNTCRAGCGWRGTTRTGRADTSLSLTSGLPYLLAIMDWLTIDSQDGQWWSTSTSRRPIGSAKHLPEIGEHLHFLPPSEENFENLVRSFSL